MRIIFTILIGLSTLLAINGQDVYTFNQTTDVFWNTSSNWTCPGGSSCPPTTIAIGDTVKINGLCRMNAGLTITNNGVVIVNSGTTLSMTEIGWFNNYGELNIVEGAFSNNNDGGVFRLHSGSTMNLDGDMEIFDDFGGDLRVLTGSTLNIGPMGTLTYF